ncbi:glycoside hydrolase family 3 protein [Listeria goaensis]|uniref:glycoside hydrolase family 3 protein n=1 Tax=Listeria goaensis TaxID=1649188 RepID=UPI001F078C4D|nr:glycoside hydrolase family 3 N-terminal domain-containing protein [Listeria goaensis]
MNREVDLRKAPYSLTEEAINWVEETLANMDEDTKIKHLFAPIAMSTDQAELTAWVQEFKPAGIMYRPSAAADIQAAHRILQENSDIPLLIGANVEAGGNGLAFEGTYVGKQLQIAATDNVDYAYQLGKISGVEARALGCNWAFAPILDVDYNFRNPITNVRTFGSDPERVAKMAKAYQAGFESEGGAVSIKHFPGDGVDERDQHLHLTHNSLSIEEWWKSYGKIYRTLIESGAHTVMAGHISFPEYSRSKGLADEEIMPATLSKELLSDLLRDELGFNGMIVTDASVMGGFTMMHERAFSVPYSIACGADLFLFNRDYAEDIAYMKAGIKAGILTMERVHDAVKRTLGVKASIGLHKQKAEGRLVPSAAALATIGTAEHEEIAREIADQAITLVKNKEDILPINPQKRKRVYLQALGVTEETEIYRYFIQKLEEVGFIVDVKPIEGWGFKDMSISVVQVKADYDLAIFYANEATMSNRTQVRLNWGMLGFNIPWFLKELPTIVISTSNPYHLIDVPQVKTLINGYSDSKYVIDAIIQKLIGESEFVGINPVDPFCGDRWDLKL